MRRPVARCSIPSWCASIGMLADGVPVFLLLPGRGGEHIRGSGSSRGRQLQVLNDACGPSSASAIDAGDLPGARPRGSARWANATRPISRASAATAIEAKIELDDVFEGEGVRGRRDRGDGRRGAAPEDAADRRTWRTEERSASSVTTTSWRSPVSSTGTARIRSPRVGCPSAATRLAHAGQAVRAAGPWRPRSKAPTMRRRGIARPSARGSYPTAKGILDDYVDQLSGLLPALR